MSDLDEDTNLSWLRNLYTQMMAFPASARADGRGHWILSSDVNLINTLRRVKNLAGYFIWLPPVDFRGDGYMLDYRVEIRDDANGVIFAVDSPNG